MMPSTFISSTRLMSVGSFTVQGMTLNAQFTRDGQCARIQVLEVGRPDGAFRFMHHSRNRLAFLSRSQIGGGDLGRFALHYGEGAEIERLDRGARRDAGLAHFGDQRARERFRRERFSRCIRHELGFNVETDFLALG